MDAAKAQVPELDRQHRHEEATVSVSEAQQRRSVEQHPIASCGYKAALIVHTVRDDDLVRCDRLYVISKCKRLKVLDYRKVKQKVRSKSLPAWPLCQGHKLLAGSTVHHDVADVAVLPTDMSYSEVSCQHPRADP